MTVFLNKDAFKPALEEVADPQMTFVEELGIDAIELSHAKRKVAVRGFDEKVIVVAHETVGMTCPVVAFIDVLEGIEKVLAVLIVLKDEFLFVSAGGDMVHSAWVFYAEGA